MMRTHTNRSQTHGSLLLFLWFFSQPKRNFLRFSSFIELRIWWTKRIDVTNQELSFVVRRNERIGKMNWTLIRDRKEQFQSIFVLQQIEIGVAHRWKYFSRYVGVQFIFVFHYPPIQLMDINKRIPKTKEKWNENETNLSLITRRRMLWFDTKWLTQMQFSIQFWELLHFIRMDFFRRNDYFYCSFFESKFDV